MLSYLPHWIFYHNLVETTRKKYSMNQALFLTVLNYHKYSIARSHHSIFVLLNDLNVLALVNRASMCSGQPTPTNEVTDQQYG